MTRNKTKRVVKMHKSGRKLPCRWGIEGPQCPHCAGHINAKLSKEQHWAEIHKSEMDLYS